MAEIITLGSLVLSDNISEIFSIEAMTSVVFATHKLKLASGAFKLINGVGVIPQWYKVAFKPPSVSLTDY